MKKIGILVIILMILLLTKFGLSHILNIEKNQDDRKVLSYSLGVDTKKTIQEKLMSEQISFQITDLDSLLGVFEIKYELPGNHKKIVLMFFDNKLVYIKFYPLYFNIDLKMLEIDKMYEDSLITERKMFSLKNKYIKIDKDIVQSVDSYIDYLDERYNIVSHREVWENNFIEIRYDFDDYGIDNFTHFDKVLIEKFLQHGYKF